MHLLSRPRRRRRPGDWTAAKTVTFIVTLAATQNVTLAAGKAGMSRKSAYALKARNSAFAAAWNEAVKARASARRQGNKVEEVEDPPISPSQGDKSPRRVSFDRDCLVRDMFFARLARESVPLAAAPAGQ